MASGEDRIMSVEDALRRRIAELEAELDASVTECMAAKSNEDIVGQAAIEPRKALQDRWAANSDTELYKANARVEAADAVLAELLVGK